MASFDWLSAESLKVAFFAVALIAIYFQRRKEVRAQEAVLEEVALTYNANIRKSTFGMPRLVLTHAYGEVQFRAVAQRKQTPAQTFAECQLDHMRPVSIRAQAKSLKDVSWPPFFGLDPVTVDDQQMADDFEIYSDDEVFAKAFFNKDVRYVFSLLSVQQPSLVIHKQKFRMSVKSMYDSKESFAAFVDMVMKVLNRLYEIR